MRIGTDTVPDELRAIDTAVSRGDYNAAFEAANVALRKGLRAPAAYNARAIWFQNQGRHEDALAEFQKSLIITPNDVNLLNAIGLCAARCNRTGDALAAFDRAIALSPNAAESHYRKGWVHAITGDRLAARAAYARAAELNPEFTEALAALAEMSARDGEFDVARDYATRSVARDPGNATAISTLAAIEIESGHHSDAEAMLRRALESSDVRGHERAVLLGRLGDALDGQERYEDAFAAYRARANEMIALHGQRMAAFPSPTKVLNSLAAYLQWAPPESWTSAPAAVERAPRAHVFILGFMRSGTTLLEQVLAQHPDALNLEERPSLDPLVDAYMRVPEGLNRLRALDDNALAQARQAYWQRVRSFGCEPEGKVFIDKQPLNTINLPLIAKLFPDAKVLFALRDPRDVVFSCFRRQFEVNPTTFQFLQLGTGAQFYAAVMTISQLCRDRLGLKVFEHRYEDMIGDFEGRVRAACDFIGLDWTDRMRDFSSQISRKTVRSASAAQVTRPLYGDAAGEWRHYAGQLGEALPALAPWIGQFGYSKD